MANNQQSSLINSPSIQNTAGRLLPLFTKNPDILLAVGILLILAMLIIPLPPFMLDFFLAVNISISVLIILVAVYLRTPLEFSAFPTILLIITLFRLSLNVASTRLILGEATAGSIIQTFGTFVISGNYVVGGIIFLILLLINFIVIIKGSTRIAEVTARFTLDALPGKQMSIDADLNAGYIDEETARKRRKDLTQEADFFGAMDGAAKFIRGDAIAGIVITGINIIGGLAIGVLQRDMSVGEAASLYSVLTIGDGLVSQIPSLLVSVAGGLVITRTASADNLEVELGKQFGGKPKPLIVASIAMLVLAIMPGFPFIPFFILALITGGSAFYRITQTKKDEISKLSAELQQAEEAKSPEEQPIENLLKVDPIEIELGYSLIALVDESQGGDVFKRITNVRRQLAIELGIILPPVRVRDNLQLEPEEYVIKIRSNEIARNKLYPNMLLAMNPGTVDGDVNGIKVTEPVFGLPATWITFNDRENAEILGYTVVEAATVLTTHLTELLKRNADKLITRQDVKHLIDNLKEDYPALVEEITPDNLPISVAQKVIQNLLAEGIPVKDLAMIMEALLEYFKVTKNIDVLTEYTRHNLSETIKKLFQDSNGVIHVITLDPKIEDTMTKALQQSSTAITTTLGLSPDLVNTINTQVSKSIDDVSNAGYMPVIICSAQVRPYLHRMIKSNFPMVSVISYTELPAETDIEVLSAINL